MSDSAGGEVSACLDRSFGQSKPVPCVTVKAGDLRKARATVEKALVAAPYDTIPKLDLAAIAHAEGHTEEAKRIVHEEVCNVLDDGGLPEDVSERTAEIIASFEWLCRRVVS